MQKLPGKSSVTISALTCSPNTGPTPSDTMTCETSAPQISRPSICFAAASHASLSLWLAHVAEQMTIAIYGPSSPESYPKSSQRSSSAKTFPESVLSSGDEYFLTCSATWPAWGMMQSGALCALPISARPINGSAFSLLPTPNARDGKDLSRSNAFLASRQKHSPSLSTILLTYGVPWTLVATLYEATMGYPCKWSEIEYTR